jgi:hypothetical protein
MSDIRSPGTEDIVSPASQDGPAKVSYHHLDGTYLQSSNVCQPHTHRLNTAVRRADSDDAPPSVIHAPDTFKQFVSVFLLWSHYMADVGARTG